MKPTCALVFAAGVFLAGLTAAGARSAPSEITVGVLAHRGADVCVQMWEPTIRYLDGEIPEYEFQLAPLGLDEMSDAVAHHKVDFVLTNPGNYVELERRFGVTRIVTLKNLRHGKPYTSFGAVIFTRADRDDIRELANLKNKSFGAVSEAAFGGFQMAWRELRENGIDPYRDFSELRFLAFPQDDIVLSVRDGTIDAGTVRTDILERMAAEGRIRLEDFRILNAHTSEDFPFALSTRLYPEWVFAKTKASPDALGKAVAIALMKMPEQHPAALAGRYAGWTVPLSYQPVHELFRYLGLGPYRQTGRIPVLEVLKQYWHWLALVVATIMLTMLHSVLVKRQVKLRTHELSQMNLSLGKEVLERKRAEQEARMLLDEKRFLAQKCMAVQEQERRHLARELHDELGQCITAIQADAESIQKLAQTCDVRVVASAGAIQNVSSRVYEVVHSIMERLRPSVLDHLGLAEALNEAVGAWQTRQPHTSYTLTTEGSFTALGEEVNISIYRIVQECLTNIAKHAMARHVQIRLATFARGSRAWIRLEVEDDGVGMTTPTLRRGLGLIGIRERVEALDGEFDLATRANAGTKVSVTMPLEPTAQAAESLR
jgi:two-component system sensor histidine kinase TtrS